MAVRMIEGAIDNIEFFDVVERIEEDCADEDETEDAALAILELIGSATIALGE